VVACKKVPIEVVIVVDDIDSVIQNYDSIKIFRSTIDEGGPYEELTCRVTRPKLQTEVTIYTYEDESGSSKYWYRFSFYNSDTLAESAQSDPEPGELHPALQIVDVEDLKTNYLYGLDLTDDAGNPYPDSLYATFIKSAVDSLEHKLAIKIKRTDYTEERHDFYRDDYENYIFVKLNQKPVISVEEVKLVLPGEQTVMTFDQDWIHLQRESGQVQMVPGVGSAGSILIGAGGAWLPFIYGHNRFIPDAFRVTYTAGFGRRTSATAVSPPDPDLDTVPDDIVDVIGKIASFGPLNIAGDLLGGAGIASQSIGIDGLSQSFNTTSSATNAGYGARLLQYSKELKEMIPILRRTYRGIGLVVV
jgi:hypothetical protein